MHSRDERACQNNALISRDAMTDPQSPHVRVSTRLNATSVPMTSLEGPTQPASASQGHESKRCRTAVMNVRAGSETRRSRSRLSRTLERERGQTEDAVLTAVMAGRATRGFPEQRGPTQNTIYFCITQIPLHHHVIAKMSRNNMVQVGFYSWNS